MTISKSLPLIFHSEHLEVSESVLVSLFYVSASGGILVQGATMWWLHTAAAAQSPSARRLCIKPSCSQGKRISHLYKCARLTLMNYFSIMRMFFFRWYFTDALSCFSQIKLQKLYVVRKKKKKESCALHSPLKKCVVYSESNIIPELLQ